MRGFGAEHSNILSVLQLGNVSYVRVIFVVMTSYRGHFQPVGLPYLLARNQPYKRKRNRFHEEATVYF